MKHLHWLLAIVLLTTGAAACGSDAKPQEADRIVAVVNNEVITLFELRSRVAQIERQLTAQKTPLPPHDVLERQMLERMITDRAQLQYAHESGIRVDDAQVDKALDRISETNHLSLSQFRMALEKDGIVWDKFRDEIKDEIILARVREKEVDNRVTVSEAEIDNYMAGPDRAAHAEELLLHHILIRIPEQSSPERLAKLRAHAEEALSQLKLGGDFNQIAATYSDAPDALTGGSLGWRTADRLPTLFAETAAKLQPGQTSEILRSAAGFHIVKLEQRRGGAIAGQPVEQTKVRHILIKPSEILSDDEARHKLDILKDRLDHGGDFAELARTHSNDPSAAKGGDLGWLYPGDTVPEFERAMNALKPGEISAPVHTQFGWHLIQVLERRTQDASAERQRMLARQVLRDRKADEAYQDWVRQLRDSAYVDIRLDEK